LKLLVLDAPVLGRLMLSLPGDDEGLIVFSVEINDLQTFSHVDPLGAQRRRKNHHVACCV
jgi:hypothetical protein